MADERNWTEEPARGPCCENCTGLAFEQKIGLYTEPDTTDTETPPFYIPPTEQDSTWILPPIEGIDIPIDSNIVKV